MGPGNTFPPVGRELSFEGKTFETVNTLERFSSSVYVHMSSVIVIGVKSFGADGTLVLLLLAVNDRVTS